MARENLRDIFLFGALLGKAETHDEIGQVEQLPEYRDFAQENFILYKRLLKKKNFGEGLALVKQFQQQLKSSYFDSRPQHPVCRLDSKCFLDEFNLSCYQQALNRLFGLISTEEELDQVCELLREYLFCTGAYRSIHSYAADHIYDEDSLTLIDLLNHVNVNALLQAFGRLYENDTERMGAFITNRLIAAIPATLELGCTPRYRIRTIITTVANAFIRQFKKKRGFRDVFNNIFLKLRSQDNNMIFCDSFTYCSILKLEDCTLSDALKLFYTSILPHSKSCHSPLIINHFIMNNLMAKAKREDSVHIREINWMFDLYKIERDSYSYNMMLESLPFEEGLDLVGKMIGSKQMQLDQYTLGSLIKTARDIPTALAFFNARELGLSSEVQNIGNVNVSRIRKVHEVIDQSVQRLVSGLQYAWLCLFRKRCSDEFERRIIDACLASLENNTELSELLEDGRLYNVCLSNPSYVRNFAEAEAFLAKHSKFVFDNYSLSHCIQILNRDNRPHTHTQVVEEANRLFRYAWARNVRPSIFHYNYRIGLFRSHLEKDAVAFLFFRTDGTEIQEPLTPIGYVQLMIELGIGIDKYTVSKLAKVPRMSNCVLRQMLQYCREQTVHIDSKIQDDILKEYGRVLTNENLSSMESLVKDSDPDLYNKQQIYRYVNGQLSFCKAIRNIDKSSLSSSILAYNALLSNFQKKEVEESRREKRRLPNLFRVGYVVYRKYIQVYSKPISDTFSILANMAQTGAEMEWIRREIMRLSNEGNCQLRFSSYLLTAQLKVQTSLNDLKFAVEAHRNAGGEITPECTDILLREIVNLANRAIDSGQLNDTALKYTEQLIDYLFHGGSSNDFLFFQMPLIENYRDPSFVSRYTIINLLGFKRIQECVTYREILEVMIARYPRLFSERNGIASYLGKRNMSISEFVPIFDLLNGREEQDIVEFCTELICQLLEQLAVKQQLRYEDLEQLVGFWALGKYSPEQMNRIAVALILLLNSFDRISPFDQILHTVRMNAYRCRLVIGDFLFPARCSKAPVSSEFSIQDNTPETSVFFNNGLNRPVPLVENSPEWLTLMANCRDTTGW